MLTREHLSQPVGNKKIGISQEDLQTARLASLFQAGALGGQGSGPEANAVASN